MTEKVPELDGLDPSSFPDELFKATTPVVLRGLMKDWPVVQAARESDRAVVDYLKQFTNQRPVTFTTAPPKVKGRLAYTDDFSGFNFTRHRGPLGATLEQILKASSPTAPSIYVGSSLLDVYLPGFRGQNPFALPAGDRELASIWVGNRIRVAAHQDLPQNIACVVAGRRRFTLFPPDQLANLYIGPLDVTIAGCATTLVDVNDPDYDRFPRFREAMAHAMVTELEPGDALVLPSMWWHNVDSLESLNILVNYWWRNEPAFMGTPFNTLMLALLTIRDLPPEQRRIWQETFRHYVFEPGEATHAHIPESARGVLAPFDQERARAVCSKLIEDLKRSTDRINP